MPFYSHFGFIFSDSYDQNFPSLPDDPISKEDLEPTTVPRSTGDFEPTQAILPDIEPTSLTVPPTQVTTRLVYGTGSTASPQTETAPMDSSESKPTDIFAAPSPPAPSDQSPTGTNAWPCSLYSVFRTF